MTAISIVSNPTMQRGSFLLKGRLGRRPMWSTLARIAAAVLAQDNPILKLARLGNQKQSPAVAAHVFRTVCGKADEWRRGDEPGWAPFDHSKFFWFPRRQEPVWRRWW